MSQAMQKDDLISAMQERAKSLLIQLESYKQIEEEYRVIGKALKVMRGESIYNKADPGIATQGAVSAKTNRGIPGSNMKAYLNIIAQYPDGISPSDAWKASGIGNETSIYTSCRRLEQEGLIRGTRVRKGKLWSTTYRITPAGRNKVAMAVGA